MPIHTFGRVALCTASLALAICLIATAEDQAASKTDAAKAAPAAGRPSAGTPEKVLDEPPKDGRNLIPNGGLDEPNKTKDGPAHWQSIDNLIWFWSTDPDAPQRGKVLKIDTDVNQSQAYAWWVQRYLKGAAAGAAPSKVPTVEPKYDTIAGLDGGFFWSDYIPVKPGGAYKVYLDAKGGGAKIFIRGYEKKVPLFFADEAPAVQGHFRKVRGEPQVNARGRPIRYYPRYVYTTWFAVGGSQQWKTYTHNKPRHPNSREITENVRWVRIMIYPYWPPGQYWFDNVRVVEVDPDTGQAKPDADEADLEEGKVVR